MTRNDEIITQVSHSHERSDGFWGLHQQLFRIDSQPNVRYLHRLNNTIIVLYYYSIIKSMNICDKVDQSEKLNCKKQFSCNSLIPTKQKNSFKVHIFLRYSLTI